MLIKQKLLLPVPHLAVTHPLCLAIFSGHRKPRHLQDPRTTSINEVQFLRLPLCLHSTGSFKPWLRFHAICTATSINSRVYDTWRPLLKKQRNPDGIADGHFWSMPAWQKVFGGSIFFFFFFILRVSIPEQPLPIKYEQTKMLNARKGSAK